MYVLIVSTCQRVYWLCNDWLVVSNMSFVFSYVRKSNPDVRLFQRSWKHQPEYKLITQQILYNYIIYIRISFKYFIDICLYSIWYHHWSCSPLRFGIVESRTAPQVLGRAAESVAATVDAKEFHLQEGELRLVGDGEHEKDLHHKSMYHLDLDR